MNPDLRLVKRLLAGTAVCVLAQVAALSANAATGDDTPPASTTAAAPSADSQSAAPSVSEVVVTARKVTENIVNAPVAITALTGRQLAARGISDYESLEAFTPGFTSIDANVNRNDRGFYSFVVRGMFPNDPESDRQGVSIFLDGTPIAGGAIAGLTDIDRVEVVNGPQSAYFGRSTFAGAVNFVTTVPNSTPGAMIDATIGQWNTEDIKASVQGPLIPDILSGRASVRYYNFGGQYQDYGYPGIELGARNTISGSVDLHFTPTNNFHANAYFTDWQDHDGPSAQGLLVNYNCNPGGGTPWFCGGYSSVPLNTITANPGTQARLDTVDANDPVFPSGAMHREGLDRSAAQGVFSAEYDFANGFALNANAGVGFNDWQTITDVINQYGGAPNVLAYVPEKEYSDSVEIRLTSPQDQKFKYTFGFNYVTEGLDFDTFIDVDIPTTPPGGLVITASPPETIDSNTYGLFGAASYDFTDHWSLDAEFRAQLDQIADHIIGTSLNASGDFNSYTPRIILQYKFTPDIQAYVSYATGTRPGQFNLAVLALPVVDQQQIYAHGNAPLSVPQEDLSTEELGLKGYFFDKTLRILTDVYYGDWTHINVGQNIEYTPGGVGSGGQPSTITITEPIGAATIYGFEFQASYAATRELTLSGTFDYAGTRIVKTDCIPCQAITGNANPAGNTLPEYPVMTASLSFNYRRPIGAGFDGYIGGDYIYTGREYDTEADTAWINPSNRVNLRIGVQNSHYTVELFGTNVFNDRTPTSIEQGTNYVSGGYALVLGPAIAQTFGVRLVAQY